MKNNLLLLLGLSILLMLWTTTSAFGLAYFGPNSNGDAWHDADKTSTNTDDDLMCWAATASNMLATTGWGLGVVSGVTNTDDIFGYYQDHWTDQGGNMAYGIDWWFDGTNDTQGIQGWSQVTAAGGGFWPSYDFLYDDGYLIDNGIYLYSGSDRYALSNIDYLLDNEYAIGLSLSGPSGHAVTAWGYEIDDNDAVSGIYITDSDDGVDELRYYDLLFDLATDAWYLQDYYGYDSYFITEVHGLSMSPFYSPDGSASQTPYGSPAVPLPTTLIMLASGLVGLGGIKRRLS